MNLKASVLDELKDIGETIFSEAGTKLNETLAYKKLEKLLSVTIDRVVDEAVLRMKMLGFNNHGVAVNILTSLKSNGE
jgi:hypothetical protein